MDVRASNFALRIHSLKDETAHRRGKNKKHIISHEANCSPRGSAAVRRWFQTTVRETNFPFPSSICLHHAKVAL